MCFHLYPSRMPFYRPSGGLELPPMIMPTVGNITFDGGYNGPCTNVYLFSFGISMLNDPIAMLISS